MKKEIIVEVGNIYKRRDGLRAFVYFRNPIRRAFDCVIIGESGLFFSVNEDGSFLNADNENPNDLVEVEQD